MREQEDGDSRPLSANCNVPREKRVTPGCVPLNRHLSSKLANEAGILTTALQTTMTIRDSLCYRLDTGLELTLLGFMVQTPTFSPPFLKGLHRASRVFSSSCWLNLEGPGIPKSGILLEQVLNDAATGIKDADREHWAAIDRCL